MKKIHFLAICLAAVLTGLYFISCSSDNNDNGDNGNNGALVGTWMRAESGGDIEYVMLCANGTGYEFEVCSIHGIDVEKFTYLYDLNNKKVTILFSDGERDVLDVVSLNDKTMTLRSSSGSVEIYTKTSSLYTQEQLEAFCQVLKNSSSYSY